MSSYESQTRQQKLVVCTANEKSMKYLNNAIRHRNSIQRASCKKKKLFGSELDGGAIFQGHNTHVGAELCRIETNIWVGLMFMEKQNQRARTTPTHQEVPE